MLLAVAGGGLGLLLAWWSVDALARLLPEAFAAVGRLGIDGRILLFGLGLSIGTGLLFGILPALKATELRLGAVLRSASPGSGGAAGGRARTVLIVAEMALSVVLLVGAGLLVRSLIQMQRADPGIRRPAGLLAVRTALPVVGDRPDPSVLSGFSAFADPERDPFDRSGGVRTRDDDHRVTALGHARHAALQHAAPRALCSARARPRRPWDSSAC